jgi:hypothetical protein
MTTLSISAERRWAAAAHLSALLTLAAGLLTGGWGAVLALLAPLGLYLFFRERAPRVAFHALQATVFQAAGAVGYVVLAVIGVAILAALWLVSAVLSLALVGLLLLPAAIAATAATAVALVVTPVAGLACALRGAYRAYGGEAFLYPLAGGLAARAMGISPAPGRVTAA